MGIVRTECLDNRRHKRSIAGIEDIVVVGEVVLFLVICREPRFTWHVNAETTAAPTKRDATIARKKRIGWTTTKWTICLLESMHKKCGNGYRQKMVGKKISDCGRGTHFSAPHFLPFWILDLRTEHLLVSPCSRESRILSIVTGQESIRKVGKKWLAKRYQTVGGGPIFAPHFLPFRILDLHTATSSCIAV